MSFQYTKAVRKDTSLLIALAGASGSGKTYSAMELAAGICGDEPFKVIDTEASRALHYADSYNFEHEDMHPPFTPESYTKVVKEAEGRGFKAIVVDSMSHEFDGEGGIMDMADASNVKGPGAWLIPKQRHKKMMNKFLQCRTHLIFCLRADEKIDMSQRDDRGKIIVTSQGWVPIQEKRFMFEMTASLTMNPLAPGIVDLSLPNKVQDQHRMAFLPGEHINRAAGEALAAWARGDEIEVPDKELWDKARKIAHEGMEQLKIYYNNVLSDEDKLKLKPIGKELNATAKRADLNRGEID